MSRMPVTTYVYTCNVTPFISVTRLIHAVYDSRHVTYNVMSRVRVTTYVYTCNVTPSISVHMKEKGVYASYNTHE